jgi:tRNA 2-thiocytidine biosynthesis protein TtcA
MKIRNKTCEALFRKLCSKADKTISLHNMLEEGDHLLLGLSGGKDSMFLLEALGSISRSSPVKFNISAVHVRVNNLMYRYDLPYMQSLCDDLNIPLYIREIAPDFTRDEKKSACFVCSWTRRKEIFNLGKELNCNKLAFGHHRDDAIETFLMNLLYHGSVSSLPYSLSMFDGRVRLVRPLLDIWEEEIRKYADLRDYPPAEKFCIYDDKTRRAHTRKLIAEMESNYKNSRINIFHAMDNLYPDYLPKSGISRKKGSE